MKRLEKYNFYLYCKPYILLLEDDLIIDANIEKSKDGKDILIIEFEDEFFLKNLKYIKEQEFTVILHTSKQSGEFVNHIEFYGESFDISTNKITLQYDSSWVNNATPTMNPYWSESIDRYKKERVSYIRNSKIENILD